MTRGGVPLHQRVRGGRPPEEPCPGRHCWVAGGSGPGDAVEKRPGLLVEWRRRGPGWEGRVVYLSLQAPGRWVLLEEWVDAGSLTPA